MKKLFTSLAALLAVAPLYAQIEVSGWSTKNSYSYQEGTEKPETPSSTDYNFFDADGNAIITIQYSSPTINTYEKGVKVKSQSYSNNFNTGAFEAGSYNEYKYDESGLLTETVSYNADGEITGSIAYENYVNGRYGDMISKNKSGDTTYWRSFDYHFEGEKLLSMVEYYHPDNDAAQKTLLDSISYTYNTDNVCTGMSQYQFDSTNGTYADEAAVSETYTYDATGRVLVVKSISSSRWGVYIAETEYTYSTLGAQYVPQNLKTSEPETNVLEISWEAPQGGAAAYKVFIDGNIEDVTTTSFKTDTLLNGLHLIGVASVSENEIRNISELKYITLEDKNVIAPSNFAVTEIKDPQETEEYGYPTTTYPVVVSWTKPETPNKIVEYRVYYNEDYNYVQVAGDQTTAEISLSSYICEIAGEDGTEGKDVTLWVKAVYATGMSERSNEVTVNPYYKEFVSAVARIEADDNTVSVYPNPVTETLYFSTPVSVTIYDMQGREALTSPTTSAIDVTALTPGCYLVKTVDEAGNDSGRIVMVE